MSKIIFATKILWEHGALVKELKSESLRVRITPSERIKLKKLAAILEEDEGVTARRAINALIRHAEANGGKITLPVDYDAAPEQSVRPRRVA